jgi:hypothetical protein
MRHSPGFHRRLALIVLDAEPVRTGLCLALLAGLGVAGMPVSAVVALPVVTYAALRLATTPRDREAPNRAPRPIPQSDAEARTACLRLQDSIRALTHELHDPDLVRLVHRLDGLTSRILHALAEDGPPGAARTLHGIVQTTEDLLARYARVVRRGFDGDDVRAQVRHDVALLDAAYERLWARLNYDVVTSLDALSAAIEFNLAELGTSGRGGGVR